MDTKQFLTMVWPSSGPYLLAVPASFKRPEDGKTINYFKHYAFDTPTAAADAALQTVATDAVDLYFALGGFVSVPEDLAKRPGQKNVRLQANVAKVRAFWLDIDVKALPPEGKENGSYRTQREAALALKAFVQQLGLPRPYVVSSGFGLHVYWPLTEDVEPGKWLHYAKLLGALAKAAALRVDTSRTTDCASVLRVPGTFNFKQATPRPVSILAAGDIVAPEAMMKALAYQVEIARLPVDAPAPRATLKIEGTPPAVALAPTSAAAAAAMAAEVAAAQSIEAYSEADPRKVVQRCQQLTWQATNQAAVDQTQWYDMIGCLRHASNGARAIRLMSIKHPEFDEAMMVSKIDQHTNGGFGPTLCNTFETHRPGGCDGCPHKGKVKTPLVLGRELRAAPAPVAVLALAENGAEEEVVLPEPAYPFKRAINPATGQARIVMKFSNKDDEEEEVEIYPYDIYPVRRTFHQREKRYSLTVRTWLPKDGWQEFEVNGGMMYNGREWNQLLGNMGVMVDVGYLGDLVQYMIGYARQLAAMQKASVIYAQLGWNDEDSRFILPNRIVTPTAVIPTEPSEHMRASLKVRNQYYEPTGDLDTWKQTVAAFNGPGREGFLFLFGTGFGAPLLKFTGYSGMVVNIVGQSGVGKSLALRAANSIWGHHQSHWVDMKNDTPRAAYQKLGTLKSLVACYDEITDLPGDVLGPFVYSVSNGRGRQRLRQDGSAADNFGDFQTLLSSTSNSSLVLKLGQYKNDASAEAARIFEYYAVAGLIDKAEGTALYDALNSNYGLAAEPFAAALMANEKHVAARVKFWVGEIDKAARILSSERFWSAAPAAVLAGFELSNSIGLTNVNVQALAQWAVDTIKLMRATVAETVRTPLGVLDDYLRGHLNSTLVLSSAGTATSPPMIANEPRGELRVRHERYAGKLYIDRAHFRRYCTDKGIDVTGIRDALHIQKVLIDDNHQCTLGKGTVWSTGQSRCWLIDMAHPSMASVAVAPGNAGAVASQAIQQAMGVTP